MNLSYRELFSALLPEAVLVGGALVILAFDIAFLTKREGALRLNAAVALGCLFVSLAMAAVFYSGASGAVFGGVLQIDRLAVAGRASVLGLTLLTLAIVPGGRVLRNPAEYVAIILFAATGFTLMSAAQQLLVVFLSIELASLSLYVLAGFEPLESRRPEAAEAALKYFLFGGMAAAFLLFGFSLIYGVTGSINMPEIAQSISQSDLSPLLAVALVMILVAFGFKAAAAPFHLWAPDAYQGAPVGSAALVASGSKVAGFIVFTRLLVGGLGMVGLRTQWDGKANGWMLVVAAMAGGSIILGNLAALAQSNVRRLLAYSAISHAGALLLGVMSVRTSGTAPLIYYVTTYGVATVGAFGVLAVLERSNGGERITDLAGLRQRSPLLTACLLVFILSLAGIPPLAGFFGKFVVFTAAFQSAGESGPTGWLAILAILFSAVGLYYYLILLKQALVTEAPAGSKPIVIPAVVAAALIIAAGILLLTGIWPSLLLQAL